MKPKILDLYIIKNFFSTFLSIIFLFIPLGILINLIDWLDKIIENNLSAYQIIEYYVSFSIYFANMLYPILLFLSIIWFTTKLANNSEIIAMLSSGISLWRFFRPYLISSILLFLIGILFSLFIGPIANKTYFKYNDHILKNKSMKEGARKNDNIYKKITNNDIIYFQKINLIDETGINFMLEHFDNYKLSYKISSPRTTYDDSTQQLFLYNGEKEYISENSYKVTPFKKDSITLPIKFEHLSQVSYKAQTLNIFDLNTFIKEEIERGSANVKLHLTNRQKRFSVPFSSIILTVIAILFSYKKKRAGFGINLFLGVFLGFSYVFLDKVLTTIISQTNTPLTLGIWLPNIVLICVVTILFIRESK